VTTPLRLVIFREDALIASRAFDSDALSIGRGAENDLALDDGKVSRAHCKIVRAHGRLWVEDLESANGTYLNGRSVDRAPVAPGDQIEVGPFRIVMEAAAHAEAEQAAGDAPTMAQPPPGERPLPAGTPAQELAVLISVLETMEVDAPPRDLVERILARLAEALDAERAILFRHDAKRGRVERLFEHVVVEDARNLPVSESLALKVANEREPVVVADLLPGAEASFARLAAAAVHSVVVVPIVRGRRAPGVVYVDSRVARRRFSTRDVDLLARVTRYLSGIVESLASAAAEAPAGHPPVDRLFVPGSPFAAVVELVRRAATTDVNVLVTGETGTGKEECAALLHRLSGRRAGPFVPVNCGAIPEALVESELFGYRKGAFSGADSDRAGLVELADKGTLMLDEVGELPATVQVKLLRVLQERRVQRLGGGDPVAVDFRLVAATHRDLATLVESGRFREDLYYRLNVFPIALPALRERKMDLPLLVEYLVAALSARAGGRVRGVSAPALAALTARPWPGNVRELRNVLERALVMEESEELTVASLPPERARAGAAPQAAQAIPQTLIPKAPGPLRPYSEELREFEREYFRRLRAEVGENISAMSRVSGISRFTLYRKLGQIGLDDDGES
jgi:DNA-binding NtrC family response regulator